MGFFRRLRHWGRDVSNEGHHTPTHDANVNAPTMDVRFQVEKCPIPIVWLDTSVVLNLAKLRLGILRDNVQENRLTRLRQSICDLTRKGKLMCPRASQADEVWVLRADFLDALHELSLGVATRPKAGIEEAQIHRLMTACIAGTRSVAFPYTDAFIDDPLPRFAQMLTKDYFVTVDGGLLGTIEQIQSQRDTLHQEWEDLRKRRTEQGITFDQQLEIERVGEVQATEEMARNCLAKVENGRDPSENERWSVIRLTRLVRTWDRLGGAPKGHQGLVAFWNTPYYGITPCMSISSALVAKLLTERRRSIKHGDAMDVDYICSVLPYADLMIVDRYMKSIVRGLGLDKEYRTKVCCIRDDKEITSFLETVEKSTVTVSPFPPFFTDGESEEST